MFRLIPRDRVFFELFEKAAANVLESIGGGVVSLPLSLESEMVVLAAMISAPSWARAAPRE